MKAGFDAPASFLLKAPPTSPMMTASPSRLSLKLTRLSPERQLFLERERAAILAEAKTDDLISEAPKPALDQSGEWQETSGEIQWVASETNDNQPEKKEEEEEELDLNKGRVAFNPRRFSSAPG